MMYGVWCMMYEYFLQHNVFIDDENEENYDDEINMMMKIITLMVTTM